MKITRTFTTFKAVAYAVELDDSLSPKVEEIGAVKFISTRGTATEARKAFQENGVTLKRGTKLKIMPIEETVYACSFEDFMSVALPVSSNKVETE